MKSITKTYRAGLEDLCTHVTVRCNGHMHKIGLSHNGEMILFDHAPDDVKRYMKMSEIGATPIRCMQIYTAWIDGSINRHNHPSDLFEFRHANYEFAHRIQRKLRRKQLQHAIAHVIDDVEKQKLIKEYHTLVGPGVDEIEMRKLVHNQKMVTNPTHCHRSWFLHRVIYELVRRGWSKAIHKPLTLPNDDNYDDWSKTTAALASNVFATGFSGIYLVDAIFPAQGYGSMFQELVADIKVNSGHIRIQRPDGTMITSFPIAIGHPESIRLQLAADVAEIGTVNALVRHNRERNRIRISEYFERIVERVEEKADISGIDICAKSRTNTVQFTIQHDRLTIQAAKLLVNTYESIEPKVQAILKANEKRLSAEHRFPPTPDDPVILGGPVPKVEKVATIPRPPPPQVKKKEDERDDITETDNN